MKGMVNNGNFQSFTVFIVSPLGQRSDQVSSLDKILLISPNLNTIVNWTPKLIGGGFQKWSSLILLFKF